VDLVVVICHRLGGYGWGRIRDVNDHNSTIETQEP
jgi:hypothetical protein